MKIKFSIYRYHPEVNKNPYMQNYILNASDAKKMTLLDALIVLKEHDPTLTFRRSCREGVCGSDGMNINGTNSLACITSLKKLCFNNDKTTIVIRPLPGFPIIRDLVVDMSQFYSQYEKVQPFLINNHNNNQQLSHEYLQSPEERSKLDGSYECILCACCSSACPSFWWNSDKFIGPAGLLTLYRFLMDSRDLHKEERLKKIENDSFSIFRCHNIMNCVNTCPKKLNPAKAIGHIKRMIAIKNINIKQ